MKNDHHLISCLSGFYAVQCSVPENKSTKKEISTQPIKVGVFDGHGGAQTCIWETIAAIRLDPEMEVCTITTADIANNVLDSIDAIIIQEEVAKSVLKPRDLKSTTYQGLHR